MGTGTASLTKWREVISDFCSAQTVTKRIFNPNFEAQRRQQVDTLV